MSPLTISHIAKLAGVGIETIRYYQRIGLIAEPDKPLSGYRVYPQATLTRLKFIQRAKQLGFTLNEIADLLELDTDQCSETRVIAEKKIQIIQGKILDLKNMQQTLEGLLKSCQQNPGHCGCPIISSLSDDVLE